MTYLLKSFHFCPCWRPSVPFKMWKMQWNKVCIFNQMILCMYKIVDRCTVKQNKPFCTSVISQSVTLLKVILFINVMCLSYCKFRSCGNKCTSHNKNLSILSPLNWLCFATVEWETCAVHKFCVQGLVYWLRFFFFFLRKVISTLGNVHHWTGLRW